MFDLNKIIEATLKTIFDTLRIIWNFLVGLPKYIKISFLVFVIILVILLFIWLWRNREAYLYVHA